MTCQPHVRVRQESLPGGGTSWQSLKDKNILSDKLEEGIQAERTVCAKVLGHHLSMEKTASQTVGSWGTPQGQAETNLERPAGKRKTQLQKLS